MKKEPDHGSRTEGAAPPAEVQAWLNDLSEVERVAMAQTWSLAGLAQGAKVGAEAVEAASSRLWSVIDEREAVSPRRPDRPAVPRAESRRMRSIVQSLVVVLLVGGGVALGWVLGTRSPGLEGTGGEELTEFMILLRGGDFEGRSPAEQQRIVTELVAWAGALRQQGRFRAGDELADGGRVLVQEEGQVIGRTFTMPSDGIGGYFIIAARDYDEAIALASGCPQLDYGGSVELRQLVRR